MFIIHEYRNAQIAEFADTIVFRKEGGVGVS